MSTYKILLSKNSVASATDDLISLHDDSTSMPDTEVTCWVNDTNAVGQVTVTDSGGCIQFDYDMIKESVRGKNSISINTTDGDPTDIHIDYIVIDDDNIVASQYLFETKVFKAKYDTSPRKYAPPYFNHKDSTYVWWGDIYDKDGTRGDQVKKHRPHLISDTGQRWVWEFSVTADGHLYWEHHDLASATYDSTAFPYWYAAKKTFEYDDSTVHPIDSAINWDPSDSAHQPRWQGPGLYGGAGEFLGVFQDSSLDTNWIDSTATVLYTNAEFNDMMYNAQYMTVRFTPQAKTVSVA